MANCTNQTYLDQEYLDQVRNRNITGDPYEAKWFQSVPLMVIIGLLSAFATAVMAGLCYMMAKIRRYFRAVECVGMNEKVPTKYKSLNMVETGTDVPRFDRDFQFDPEKLFVDSEQKSRHHGKVTKIHPPILSASKSMDDRVRRHQSVKKLSRSKSPKLTKNLKKTSPKEDKIMHPSKATPKKKDKIMYPSKVTPKDKEKKNKERSSHDSTRKKRPAKKPQTPAKKQSSEAASDKSVITTSAQVHQEPQQSGPGFVPLPIPLNINGSTRESEVTTRSSAAASVDSDASTMKASENDLTEDEDTVVEEEPLASGDYSTDSSTAKPSESESESEEESVNGISVVNQESEEWSNGRSVSSSTQESESTKRATSSSLPEDETESESTPSSITPSSSTTPSPSSISSSTTSSSSTSASPTPIDDSTSA